MTASLRIKDNRYYAVINYKEGAKYKQKWISLHMPAKNNKRKAEEMLLEIKAEFEGNYISRIHEDMPFVEFVKQWLERKKPFIELSTWEGYEIYATKHIIPYFKPLRLSIKEVRPLHIQEYYNYKYSHGRADGKPGGLSIASLKKHSIVLKEVLQEAVLYEYIERNPAQGVRLPARLIPVRKPSFLTAEQANKLLVEFKGHPLQGVVYTALYYGLRRSEVLGLRWQSVDFDAGTLTIEHTVVKTKTVVRKDKTKTQSSHHTYVLIDDVREALIEQKRRQEENKRAFGKAYVQSDYIFTWDDGRLFSPDYLSRGFKNVVKRAGMPDVTFHGLRHSTASILYDKGWDIKDAQTWLRHSSVKVTGDIYTHVAEDRKASMATKLDKTFSM